MTTRDNFQAVRAAREIGADPAEVFGLQFALTPDRDAGFPGFEAKPFGERTLLHCPRLAVARLFDQRGAHVGYCLGVAVCAEGERIEDGRVLNAVAGSTDFWPRFDRFVIGAAGRYLMIVSDGAEERVYGDPCGMCSCFIDQKTGAVGSSLLMTLRREISENEDIDSDAVQTGALRPPFGRTRDEFVRALPANHCLRLNDQTLGRYWPQPGAFRDVGEDEIEGVLIGIGARLSAVIGGIARSTPAALSMSGGNDSRTLMACAKPSLGDLDSVFTFAFDRTSRADAESAELVTTALELPINRLDRADPGFTEEEMAAYEARRQLATGYGAGAQQISAVKLNGEKAKPGAVFLGGNVLEVMRASFWGGGERNRRLNRKFGLKRCLFVRHEGFTGEFVGKWLPHYARWFDALPPDARHVFIDMGFFEHHLPLVGVGWLENSRNFTVAPANDRGIMAAAAGLPLAYRHENQANKDLLRLMAPELAEVPYAWELMKMKRD